MAILGVGSRLPDAVRENDDPVFDWLRAHPPHGGNIFDGLKRRRVLERADDVVDLVAGACRDAIADATVPLGEIDLFLGSASVSANLAPNGLCAVHRALGLPASCRVIPLASDYTVFLDGLRLADDAIKSGSARRALVACGNNWTHHVSYREAVSFAASDAAGAAVVGRTEDGGRFALLDREEETDTAWLGAFQVGPRHDGKREERDVFTPALMTIDDHAGIAAIRGFGVPAPGRIIARLLGRHGLGGKDVTLVAHQASKSVYEAWKAAIAPAHFVSTLEDLGNMVSSSVAVNLARGYAEIQTRHLVLLGIGMEMHATALLYARA